ncbi:MAG: bacteriohopanetetrol glucosamine biosynthesis glycosyltransferase HpnI [Candidatus Eremiobacteraeota bacterium]|nr:bacteriohopanetetrol glucosamine biosynthesis glycosyltransferase HpnI [Candidatus Eremiobacteraeota bacterium]
MALVREVQSYAGLFFLVVSVLALFYLVIANAATIAFRRRPLETSLSHVPSITVLKPVCGLEEGLDEAIASVCDQEYPGAYEVLFCVHDSDDPALAAIERAMTRYPHCDARIAVGDNPTHRNPKIANLSKGAAAARGDIVVIADSDIVVDRHYLRAIAAAFENDRTGAVTCLYRGIPRRGLVGALGAAYVEEQFAPSVLVTVAFGTLRFCLGATMAVRRTVLEAIGGIDVLGAFLADDHKLGELVAAHGHDVKLSRYVVATSINEATLRQLWSHELRWARTAFVLAPVGYTFSFFMYALPLAALYTLVSWNFVTGIPLMAAALFLRLLLQYNARAALGVTRTPAPWIAPLRDFLSFALWAASLAGRSVRWRGTRLAVDTRGEVI